MPFQQVTLATLRTRLFEQVDTSQHWVDAEALIKINDALRFWNLLTGYWRRSLTKTIMGGSGDPYNFLAGTLTWPMRMQFTTTGVPIEKTSIAALDMGRPRWEGESIGDPGVPDRLTFWAPRALQFFVVWPKPIVDTAVDLDGISETPVLAADGDFVDLEDGIQDVLVDYAAHLLQFKDGGPKFYETAGAYNTLIELAGAYNDQLRATTIYKQAMTKDHDRDQRHRIRPMAPVPQPLQGQTRQRSADI